MAEDHRVTPPCIDHLPLSLQQQASTSKKYRSSGHTQHLLEGLVALRDSRILFDVQLVVEEKMIEAHRIVLAASCDYFRGMFTGGLREMQQGVVQIRGIAYVAMCNILDFIYTSEIELSLDNVQETLLCASILQFPEIIQFCCDFLTSWLDEENVLEMYKLADVLCLPQLQEQVDFYILKNFSVFSKSEAYRKLPLEKVCSLLSSNHLEVNSETEVYEAALHYYYTPEQIEMDEVSLHEPLKLLELVRFPLMEHHVLQRLHDRLSPCPLRELVASALNYHDQEISQPVLQSPLTELRSKYHCVVSFGGMYSPSSQSISSQARYLHPILNEWRPLTVSQDSRMSNQGVAVLNNFVYLIGGDCNSGGFQAECRCWRYDPRHNQWFQIKPLQHRHADHCVCVLNECLYAIAGRDYTEELTVVEKYNPASDSWEMVTPLKKTVFAHAGAVVDGKIYISCGRRNEDYLKELHCYDPLTDCWENKADSLVERAWHCMATVNSNLYVIGGSNNSAGYRRDVLQVTCYNTLTDQWTSVSPLPSGHGEPGIAVLQNKIYVLGGRSHNRATRMDYVHIYDAEMDQWNIGPRLDEEVSGLAACVLTLPRALIVDAANWTTKRQPVYRRQPNLDYDDDSSTSDWDDLAFEH
ncbi:kelch-like protein 22 [Protopterus annectens]|uniref:kelch-like protein 22 n=1 Tax=Protopterus annectens TaxID=7888 RepID=UPI001CFB6B31|nr:kelch-like protein 22 [Protopterus annectens]